MRKMFFVLAFVSICIVAIMAPIVFYAVEYPFKYENLIREYADDPGVIASIIRVESRYNSKAVSAKGAIGLMQLMPDTAAFVAHSMGESFVNNNLFDSETNIKYGSWYFSYLQNKFETLEETLAAYNAGEGNVRKWKAEGKTLEEIPFPETREYVRKVKSFIQHYNKKFD